MGIFSVTSGHFTDKYFSVLHVWIVDVRICDFQVLYGPSMCGCNRKHQSLRGFFSHWTVRVCRIIMSPRVHHVSSHGASLLACAFCPSWSPFILENETVRGSGLLSLGGIAVQSITGSWFSFSRSLPYTIVQSVASGDQRAWVMCSDATFPEEMWIGICRILWAFDRNAILWVRVGLVATWTGWKSAALHLLFCPLTIYIVKFLIWHIPM